ncbi:molybdopterin cofactor-binding domain-containing protein [Enterovirga sp. CN4-39]|uniref:molybdopterin cofactor-binding domain-containing protein n=1 Tax=Enterovirga sp. CN4-39 TaxID=3400910 RepID=UPI003C0A30FA
MSALLDMDAGGAREARVGDSTRKLDGLDKARGAFTFSGDLVAPGMLAGATVRSPHAYARILSVDTAVAAAMPGVHAVMTHADVPGSKFFGHVFRDQPVLAFDRVRYFGEPVAVVAAETAEQAYAAAAKVRVAYEPLRPIVDPEEAPYREPLHEAHPTIYADPEIGYVEEPMRNVVRKLRIVHGDPAVRGEVVVSGFYEVGMQDQAFLGTESGLAAPDGRGGIDLYVASQWLHLDLAQIAPCLGLAEQDVRVHLAGVGGAFGGREDISVQIHAAMLALRTRRPVRFVYSREESFVGHPHRHPARMWYEHSADRDGRLVSVRAHILMDGGAYASTSSGVMANACKHGVGPYRVDNALITGAAVFTNNPPCGAMRGYGAVQSCFAVEAQMDKLASALGMDPVELRLCNAMDLGDRLPIGQEITGSLPTAEVIRRCAALPMPPLEPTAGRDPIRLPGGAGNTTRGESVRRGVGFAVGFKNICYSDGNDDYCTARIRLHADPDEGIVAEIHSAASEVGQGVTNVIRQVVNTELAVDRVVLAPPSTASVGSAGSSSASRQTFMTAGAVQQVCRLAREELERRGGRLSPGDEIDIERIYRHVPTGPLAPRDGQATTDRALVALACAAMRVVVEVDVELGLTRVAWIGISQDVGRAINPIAVRGQIEGGTAQGLGLALMEEIQLHDGVIANASFTDYLIPTMLDMPRIAADLVEEAEPVAPYGLKGVGEPPTVVATAAILAAVRDATGKPLTRTPVRPDDIVFGSGAAGAAPDPAKLPAWPPV